MAHGREIYLIGYNESSGNTENSQLSFSFYVNRKTESDEFTIKGDSFYSSSNNEMDAQRWSGMVRYAFSFWENKWYNFYRIESDHDRFANVDYRIVPSLGMGYWFSDEDEWRVMVEAGAGLEHTNLRDDSNYTDEAVLIARAFFEKRLLGEAKLKEDCYIYPSVENGGDFRFHSETVFENPIDDKLSLRISVVDDYDSDPSANTKKNDARIITSLTYSF